MDLNTEYQSETVLREFAFTLIIRGNEKKSMVTMKSEAAVRGLGKNPRHR